MATLQTELAQREEALRFLSDPNVRYVSLGGAQADAGGERVAPLEPDDAAGPASGARPARRAGGARLRALGPRGRRSPCPRACSAWTPAGRALLRLPALPEGHTFDAFAVTLEPAGGVPKPTGPMHLHGKV